ISKEDVEKAASKYLNIDDKPKITLNNGKIDFISLRVDFNNPIKVFKYNNICEAVSVIVKFLEELGIVWKVIEIYETTTYEEEGGIIAGSTANLSSATKKDLLIAVSSAVLGGLAGYLIGGKLEKVEKIVCEYENKYGFPILVYKGLENEFR
ncbi:hypothetical protein DJ522_09145, partial [Sulfolobus sp. F3]